MSEHIKKTIADLLQEIAAKEDDIRAVKRTVNMLATRMGEKPPFNESELSKEPSAPAGEIQSDAFYGQPLATSVRKILADRRKAGGGPMAAREIFETLKAGGYQFDTASDQNAIRSLRISLSKNVRVFHKLPGGSYGLTEWYPDIKDRRHSAKEGSDEESQEGQPGGPAKGQPDPADEDDDDSADEAVARDA